MTDNMTRRRQWGRTRTLLLTLMLWLPATIGSASLTASIARADGGAPNLAYVAGGGAGADDLVVIDIAKRQVTGRATVGGGPAGVVLSADGRFAYVTQSRQNAVAVVDTRELRVVATIPVGAAPRFMALDQTSGPNLLYVSNSGGNTVSVVNPDAHTVVATLPVGQHPGGLAIALNGTGIVPQDINDAELYIANTDSDSVTVVSIEHRRALATITVPGGPEGIVVPQSGGVAYVSLRSGAVAVVGLASHTLLGIVLPAPPGAAAPPGVMDYDAVTGQIYVPQPAAGIVDILAPASAASGNSSAVLPHEPARALTVAGGPSAVAVTFDGVYGFIAQRESGQVTMIDIGTHQPLAQIAVGGAPQAVITGAYPPLLNRQTANVAAYIVTGVLVVVLVLGIFFVVRGSRRDKPATASNQPGKDGGERSR